MSTSGWKTRYRALGLEASERFWALTDAEIDAIYNGAGPDEFDGWPAWFLRRIFGARYANEAGRALLTQFLRIFEPAYPDHDVEYWASDHTEASWHTANDRMRRNMRRLLDLTYPAGKPWLWPARIKWMWRAWLAWRAVESDDGYRAWMDETEVAP